MAYNGWNQEQQFGNSGWGDQNSFSYDMGSASFGQEQQFQSFDYTSNVNDHTASSQAPPPTYTSSHTSNSYGYYSSQQPTTMMTPAPIPEVIPPTDISLEDEPPLLEELGIDPDAIVQKTLTVLNPMRHTDPTILQDTDLAGPLAFCLAYGSLLLLSGKVHFGYIYGIGLLGCIALYLLLNLMSIEAVGFGVVVSVLGYCILPMAGLAGINVLISLQGVMGLIITSSAIIWCSWSASKLFVTALGMHQQQPLVAYPCALLYAVFALITIF